MESPLRQHQIRVQQELQEQMQQRLNQHIADYDIYLKYPAEVVSSSSGNKIRTNTDLIQHRLLEAGVLLDDVQKLGQVTEAVSKFVGNLEQSECFESVQVQIGSSSDTKEKKETTQEGLPIRTLQVVLKEKKWYSAYIGGGVKHDSLYSGDTNSMLPKFQFETRAKLLNLSGHLDVTSLNYAIDQTSTSTISLQHERPLYTLLNEYSQAYNNLLTEENGSQVSLSCRAVLDTIDHEWTRSYKEYQRLLAVKIANVGHTAMPEAVPKEYSGLEWSLLFRDIMPRRHTSLPYALDASPEILAQSGPSVKHSIVYELRSKEHANDPYNPTEGVQHFAKAEVAGPPGDVGFWKFHGGLSHHALLFQQKASLHSAFQFGILRPISFGGLCPKTSTCIADKFFVGGPMELRGFVPAGIGPRAPTGGASTPGGDALGGNFFYTATLAASMPFPAIQLLRENGVRLLGFANFGTLVGLDRNTPLAAVLKSTRASVGGGVTVGTNFGRLEATYAWPLRYGPRDARKSVQIGLGFQFA